MWRRMKSEALQERIRKFEEIRLVGKEEERRRRKRNVIFEYHCWWFNYLRSVKPLFLINDCFAFPPQWLNCFLFLDSLLTLDSFIILLLLNSEPSFSCTLASIPMSQHCSLEEMDNSTQIFLFEGRKQRADSSFILFPPLLAYFYWRKSELVRPSSLFWNQQCRWCCFRLNIGICTHPQPFKEGKVNSVESFNRLDIVPT